MPIPPIGINFRKEFLPLLDSDPNSRVRRFVKTTGDLILSFGVCDYASGLRYALAESAIVTMAAPNMMQSLMMSLPIPERYGKP
jgi:hypothetical protein